MPHPSHPAEFDSGFVGKDFPTDRMSKNFSSWRHLLEDRRLLIYDILEVGSRDGRSTAFFLDFFPQAFITCVNAFAGGRANAPVERAKAEERFDNYLRSYGSRVEKVAAEAGVALHDLVKDQRKYDLIYIGGSHVRDDVLIDSLLAWRLTHPGTIVLWDDDEEEKPDQPFEAKPKIAVDRFFGSYAKQFQILHKQYQLAAVRTV